MGLGTPEQPAAAREVDGAAVFGEGRRESRGGRAGRNLNVGIDEGGRGRQFGTARRSLVKSAAARVIERSSRRDLMRRRGPGCQRIISGSFGIENRTSQEVWSCRSPAGGEEGRRSLEVEDDDLRVKSGKFSDQTAVSKR
ncbi:hypothetical protein LINGRAHAP2_LOCUS23062 [Linum grandiflorum]